MKHLEMNWKARDGLDIFAQSWEPTILQPKAVVCLVHGLGEHTSRYAHVAEAFGRQGFVLFGADSRGHGRSDGARGHISSIEDFMQDIDELLGQARARYPDLPIILYGHSLGGIQVLHYGLTHKPDVKGVIATSSGLKSSSNFICPPQSSISVSEDLFELGISSVQITFAKFSGIPSEDAVSMDGLDRLKAPCLIE